MTKAAAKKTPASTPIDFSPLNKPASEPAQKDGATLMRKLSAKNIVGKIDVATLSETEPLKLYRLAGVATGYESGETSFGPWECLTGEFAAVNFLTGERFAGNKAFVPSGQGDGIVSAAAHALREDANSKIKFAVDVFALKVVRGKEVGYVYTITPLIKINIKNEALDLLDEIDAKTE